MILRRVARPTAFAKSFQHFSVSRPSSIIQQQCRAIHAVPPLGGVNNERGVYFHENGVPGFLAPKTFRQNWEVYQDYLVTEINSRIGDTEWAGKTAYQMHIEFSRQPAHADLYNFAAMAHFNHLWWESISDVKTEVPNPLMHHIELEFTSLDQLRTQMLECGDAIFGNGFVWLVKETSHSAGSTGRERLRIVCTYNAGSPYSKAWRMRQDADSATGSIMRPSMHYPQNRVGSNRYMNPDEKDRSPNSLVAYPILCLNVWQHMWIPDYGIMGKRQYLGAWWERIDWQVVFNRFVTAEQKKDL